MFLLLLPQQSSSHFIADIGTPYVCDLLSGVGSIFITIKWRWKEEWWYFAVSSLKRAHLLTTKFKTTLFVTTIKISLMIGLTWAAFSWRQLSFIFWSKMKDWKSWIFFNLPWFWSEKPISILWKFPSPETRLYASLRKALKIRKLEFQALKPSDKSQGLFLPQLSLLRNWTHFSWRSLLRFANTLCQI